MSRLVIASAISLPAFLCGDDAADSQLAEELIADGDKDLDLAATAERGSNELRLWRNKERP